MQTLREWDLGAGWGQQHGIKFWVEAVHRDLGYGAVIYSQGLRDGRVFVRPCPYEEGALGDACLGHWSWGVAQKDANMDPR